MTERSPDLPPSQSHDNRVAWLLLSPGILLLGLFGVWPLGYLLVLSFTTDSFTRHGSHWAGLTNYWRLATDPDFWQVLGNTAYFTLATVLPSLIIPLGLAVLLDQHPWIRGVMRTAFFLPSVTSIVAAGLGFRWLFQTEGPVNTWLTAWGLSPIAWLSSPVWAMWVLILLSCWQQLGFNLVVLLAGLQTIPLTRYEAAELDGANSWQQFWHITLPGLQSTLIFAGVTTVIFTLKSFEQVYVVTGGGPLNSTNLLVFYIYQQAFGQFDVGYAAAAAVLLLGITGLLAYWQADQGSQP
jgi:multiple sugar transport system permease protein